MENKSTSGVGRQEGRWVDRERMSWAHGIRWCRQAAWPGSEGRWTGVSISLTERTRWRAGWAGSFRPGLAWEIPFLSKAHDLHITWPWRPQESPCLWRCLPLPSCLTWLDIFPLKCVLMPHFWLKMGDPPPLGSPRLSFSPCFLCDKPAPRVLTEVGFTLWMMLGKSGVGGQGHQETQAMEK